MGFDMNPFDSKMLEWSQDGWHGRSGAEKDQKAISDGGCRYSDYP